MSDRENLLRLASACRKCQEPTCQLACPAGVPIPQFIGLFLDGKEREAYEAIRQANVFPEVCAWLCPVEQQCQGNCLQSFIGDGPLPIADIQKYLAVQANKNGWSRLRIPDKATGKKIAIIGAGPAGLACAARLLEAGHTATIFDKSAAFGGTVESVIPPDRQCNSLKNELSAIFADVPKDRMILRLGKKLDVNHNLDTILSQGFDAAFIGLGLQESVSIESRRLSGLWNAMDFLSAAKQPGAMSLADRSVAVIGGGNTAMDVAVTARQLGAGCLCDLSPVLPGDARVERRAGPRHPRGRAFPCADPATRIQRHQRQTHGDQALSHASGRPGCKRPQATHTD